MSRRLSLVLLVLGAIGPSLIQAESTNCSAPVVIVADGRDTASSFPQGTSYWYAIYAQTGHSYSVEFAPAADNFSPTPRVLFGPISVFGPNDSLVGCRGNSSVALTQTSGYSPAILKGNSGAGRRVSFTAQVGGLYVITIGNVGGAGSYSFRAVDTTMFSTRWSTYGGYDNHWGFLNVSDMPITGMLTVYDISGNVVASAQLNIPVGAVRLKFSFPSDMNLPRNSAGYAMFSHNGPPGAIVADSYMANLSINVVFPSKFETRSPQ